MDRDAASDRDEADDLIPGNRSTAASDPHQEIVHALHDDAAPYRLR